MRAEAPPFAAAPASPSTVQEPKPVTPMLAQHSGSTIAKALPLVCVVAALGILIWGTVNWQSRKQRKEKWLAPVDWCYFLYLFGAIGCVMAWIPDPEMEQSGNGFSPQAFCLLLGLGLILVGLVIHAVLKLRGRTGVEMRGRWALVILAVVLMAVLHQYLARRGLEHWLAYAVGALLVLVVVLIGLIVLVFFLRLSSWAKRVNRMARLIDEQEYEEAARLGESLLPAKGAPENVDTMLEANLAVAYQLSGEEEKAKAIFEQLQARPNLPEPIAKMVDERLRQQSESKQAPDEKA